MQALIRSRQSYYSHGAHLTLWASIVPDQAGERYAIAFVLPDGERVYWRTQTDFSATPVYHAAVDVQPSLVIIDSETICEDLPVGTYAVIMEDERGNVITTCWFARVRQTVLEAEPQQLMDGVNCERWPRDRVLAVLKATWPECKTMELTDGSYLVPSLRYLRYLAAVSGIDRRRYESDHDCDDFTFAWLGWAHQRGLSAGSWGYSVGPGHAMGVAVCSDATAWLVEPQTGLLQSAEKRRANGWVPRLILM